MVVQTVYGRERTLTVRNQHIGRNRIVTTKSDLYLLCLIALTLLLEKHLCLIAVRWYRRWHQHAVKHFLSSHTTPLAEVFDVTITPSQREVKVGN